MVDYSKWQNIEVSDDEDDTLPNVDTPLLFKWRHQASIGRMMGYKIANELLEKLKAEHDKKYSKAKQKLSDAKNSGVDNLADLQQAFKILEQEDKEILKIADDLKRREKKTPSNLDKICKPGFSKTMINTGPTGATDKNLTEKELKHYGMLRKHEDSYAYLKAHDSLICEDAKIYLASWCVSLEMKQERESVECIARQTMSLQYILQLAKQLARHPRDCLGIFFAYTQEEIKTEFKSYFDEQLLVFKERIGRHARDIEAAVEGRRERSVPSGLDAVEVAESQPDE